MEETYPVRHTILLPDPMPEEQNILYCLEEGKGHPDLRKNVNLKLHRESMSSGTHQISDKP